MLAVLNTLLLLMITQKDNVVKVLFKETFLDNERLTGFWSLWE